MFKYNKSFGQNFLKNKAIIEEIIKNCNIDKDTLVIEVGPGMGALTEKIVPLSKNTIIYEIDSRLENILNNKLSLYNNYELIINDFLKEDVLSKIKKYNYKKIVFVSNLPYYITTPIITKLIEDNILPDEIIIMLQKEVADRYTSNVNTKDYGYITVLLNVYYNLIKVIDVDKNNFEPIPNVDSSVIKMKKNNQVEKIKDIKKFNKFVKDAFQFKRKNLKNNLKSYDLNRIEEILKKYNLSLNDRAENISLVVFIELANNIV